MGCAPGNDNYSHGVKLRWVVVFFSTALYAVHRYTPYDVGGMKLYCFRCVYANCGKIRDPRLLKTRSRAFADKACCVEKYTFTIRLLFGILARQRRTCCLLY